jgi:beta-1,4-N-acetylglucosaminyltransferase
MNVSSLLMLSLSLFSTMIVLSVVRLLWILPSFRTQSRPSRRSTVKLVIVLGSGGHTAEILRLIEPLNFDKYMHRLYVVSSGDTLSEGKARAFELKRRQGEGNKGVISPKKNKLLN